MPAPNRFRPLPAPTAASTPPTRLPAWSDFPLRKPAPSLPWSTEWIWADREPSPLVGCVSVTRAPPAPGKPFPLPGPSPRWRRPRTDSARCQRQPGSPPGPIFPSGSQRSRCPGQPWIWTGREPSPLVWSVAPQLPALRRPRRLPHSLCHLVTGKPFPFPGPWHPLATAPNHFRPLPQAPRQPGSWPDPIFPLGRWSVASPLPRSAGPVGCPIPCARWSLVSHSRSPARWRRPRTTPARCQRHRREHPASQSNPTPPAGSLPGSAFPMGDTAPVDLVNRMEGLGNGTIVSGSPVVDDRPEAHPPDASATTASTGNPAAYTICRNIPN